MFRCKAGFQRDKHGGCIPIAYRCVNHAEPLKFDGKVVTCIASKEEISQENEDIETLNDELYETTASHSLVTVRTKRENQHCPSHYYCIPIFDVPKQSDLYQVSIQFLFGFTKHEYYRDFVALCLTINPFVLLGIRMLLVKLQIMVAKNVHGIITVIKMLNRHAKRQANKYAIIK